jgi:hypothetical protein
MVTRDIGWKTELGFLVPEYCALAYLPYFHNPVVAHHFTREYMYDELHVDVAPFWSLQRKVISERVGALW